jgi:hypothetical protein
MNTRHYWFGIAAAALLLVSTAHAQINGLVNDPRVFNDHPTSILTMVNSNSVNPGSASIDDVFTEGDQGANRHDVLLSSDSGATPHTFDIADMFTMKAEVTLSDGTDSPRKEAGLRLNSPVTGDVLFIINSDAGEIVAFGGGAAFYLFGNNAGANGYTPGDTILMGMTYRGNTSGTAATPATMEYFIDRTPAIPGGIETSGPLAFSNLEFGAVNFEAGFYAQGQSSGDGDYVNAEFTNIMYMVVPEPMTISTSVIGIVGLAFMFRRRIR